MSWFAQTCFTWPGGGEGRRGTEWLRVACFNQPGLLVELELLVLTLFNDASSSSARIAQHVYGLQGTQSPENVSSLPSTYLLILIFKQCNGRLSQIDKVGPRKDRNIDWNVYWNVMMTNKNFQVSSIQAHCRGRNSIMDWNPNLKSNKTKLLKV